MDTYVNPNDTYVPSAEVEQGIKISDGDFQKSKDYYIEGATTPIALFCVGFVALVVFNICLCCGVAKVCTRGKSDSHTLSCGEYCTSLIFTAFFIICLLAAHILYLGYSDVGDALDIMRTSTDEIESGFDDMNDHVNSLYSASEDLLPLCTAYNCQTLAEAVSGGVEYMSDDLGAIPDDVLKVNEAIDNAETVVNLLTFVMYCFLMVALVVYLLTQFCCKAAPSGAICCGNIAFCTVAFIGILWMVITSVTADFCYENPTINTLNAMSASKDQMYLVWYSSCHSGENPVHRYVNYTNVANEAIIDSLVNDTSTEARDIRRQTTLITHFLGDLTQATHDSCSPVQAAWLLLLNDGVCDSFFLGVRTIWICEVAACISLFFLMITGAIIGKAAKDSDESVRPYGGAGRRGKYEIDGGDLEFEEEEAQQEDVFPENSRMGGGRAGGKGKRHGGQLGEDEEVGEDQQRMSLDFEY